MKFWKVPPKIKIYEALGAVADERIELTATGALVDASSRNKTYTVSYSESDGQIMANDNGSYWQGYLGYPAICLLMLKGKLPYKENFVRILQGIEWKKVNQSFKNDFSKTEALIEAKIESSENLKEFHSYIQEVLEKIKSLNLGYEGTKAKPAKETK
ncbi:MAG: hypothetical protein R3B52_03490 [Candidatus Paceibacterota bacterium]